MGGQMCFQNSNISVKQHQFSSKTSFIHSNRNICASSKLDLLCSHPLKNFQAQDFNQDHSIAQQRIDFTKQSLLQSGPINQKTIDQYNFKQLKNTKLQTHDGIFNDYSSKEIKCLQLQKNNQYNKKNFNNFKKGLPRLKSPIQRIPQSTKVIMDNAVNDVSSNQTENFDSIINWNRSLYEKKGKFINIQALKTTIFGPQTQTWYQGPPRPPNYNTTYDWNGGEDPNNFYFPYYLLAKLGDSEEEKRKKMKKYLFEQKKQQKEKHAAQFKPRNQMIVIQDLDLFKNRSKSLPNLRIQNEKFLMSPYKKDEQKYSIFKY